MATTRQKAAQGSYPSLSGKIETAELLRRLKVSFVTALKFMLFYLLDGSVSLDQ